MSDSKLSDRIVLSTSGSKDLWEALAADRENVIVLIGFNTPQGELTCEVFVERLETLSVDLKTLLAASLTKAAEAVDQSMASHVDLPPCREITGSRAARLWGCFWRLALNRPHILERAATKLGGHGLLVGARTIEGNARMEVIFEEGLLEGLLNINGKRRLAEWLRRASYVVECRGGKGLLGSRK
jgi:hypothetical protein